MTPGEVVEKLKQDLGQEISDRTVRRWRSLAFLPPQKLYSQDDYNKILLLGQLIRSFGRKDGQEKFIQILEERHAQRESNASIEIRCESV